MSDTQYRLDYSSGAARQVGTEIVHAAAPRVETQKRKRRFRIPAALNTAITVVVCGGIFTAAVLYMPEGFRPQDIAAEYGSEIAGEVKEDEGAVEAEVQAYVNGVRAAYEQHNAQYGRIVEGYLDAYRSSLTINQQQADAANRLRGAYVERQMTQTVQSSGTNVGIANAAQALGELQNWLEPGSGDATLAEADRQRAVASNRLQEVTVESASIDLGALVSELPSEEALRQRIESLPPVDLPEPPAFVRERN